MTYALFACSVYFIERVLVFLTFGEYQQSRWAMSKTIDKIEKQIAKRQEKLVQLKAQKKALKLLGKKVEPKKRKKHRTDERQREILIGKMIRRKCRKEPSSDFDLMICRLLREYLDKHKSDKEKALFVQDIYVW
jgi:hypothetical protein